MSFQSLCDIAENMLSADSIVNSGNYSQAIYAAFGAPKNILTGISIEEETKGEKAPYLSYEGTVKVKFTTDEAYLYQVYSLNGQLLSSGTVMNELHLDDVPSIIHITSSTGIMTVLKKP